MAHLTNKKMKERKKNNLGRSYNGFNTGTRNMGFGSNNERKTYLQGQLATKQIELDIF